jgi:hypothetical protein
MKKISNRLFVILALILLCCSGCSTISLGYNYADWLLRFWINDYTTFNVEQKEQIHLEIDDYMRWHRREALPGYVAFLQNVNAAIGQKGSVTVGDVVRLRDESNQLYQLTMAPMVHPAAHMLSTLDSQQIAELANTFAERDRKQRKKMLDSNEQKMLAMRAERHVEFVENLVGSLSTEQQQKITEMSLLIPFATRHYIEQREAKHATLIALLRDKAGEDRIATLFQQWLTAPAIFRTPQQQQSIAAYESAMNEMTVRIFELLTTRQKLYLSGKIISYIDDFKKLNSSVETANAPSYRPRVNESVNDGKPL